MWTCRASIYQSSKKPNTFSQNIRAPSQFNESYRPKIIPVVPTIPPRPVVAAPPPTKKLKKQQAVEDKTKPGTEPKKPVAMVNFNIFKEVIMKKSKVCWKVWFLLFSFVAVVTLLL